MPDASIPGRALVSRHAVIDIVRRVTLGSYGVAGFDAGIVERVLGVLERRPGGLRVAVDRGALEIHLRLRVAHGLPIAEVARQVDSAIRYDVRRALDRDVDRLTIRVAGFDDRPGATPPGPAAEPGVGSSELAGSGTDVA